MTTSWLRIGRKAAAVAQAIQDVKAGSLIEVLFDDV